MTSKTLTLPEQLRAWSGNSFGPYRSPLPEMLAAANEIELLRAALIAAKVSHDVCDDCWYSCPKSGECCDDDQPKDHCRCGADRHNAAIEKALSGETGSES